MLDTLGLPFLRWLDEVVLPEAHEVLTGFQVYIGAWISLLEDED